MAFIRFLDKPLYRNPWAEMDRMRREMESWSHLFAGTPPRNQPGSGLYPAVNISEDDANIYIRAEMPGVAATQQEIYIEGETLTIKGARQPGPKPEKVAHHRREIEYGSFNRAITLPTKVMPDKVTAQSANGILTIVLPKVEEVKPRQISVSIG